MSTVLQGSVPVRPLRDDAGVIGLVGLAHLISHFCQLLLEALDTTFKGREPCSDVGRS